jgi:hypothetical protein
VAAQNVRIVTTANARDVRGENDGDDSKGIHSGKLAPISTPEIPVIVVPVGVISVIVVPVIAVPMIAVPVIAVPMIPRVILRLDFVLPNRLRAKSRGFHLTGANGFRLSLTRDLELTLLLDLILALACDLELTLTCDLHLALANDLLLVESVVVVDGRPIDDAAVRREPARRSGAACRCRLTTRRNSVNPDSAHARRGNHAWRHECILPTTLGHNRRRNGKGRRGCQKFEFAHVLLL